MSLEDFVLSVFSTMFAHIAGEEQGSSLYCLCGVSGCVMNVHGLLMVVTDGCH